MIRKGKHNMIHYFKHVILQIEREEIIGTIVPGFTCLVPQIVQSLVLKGLQDCPMLMHLINDNQKHKSHYINKTVHQIFPNC
jgi:predicted nucleic acid-binding Zn finger protein